MNEEIKEKYQSASTRQANKCILQNKLFFAFQPAGSAPRQGNEERVYEWRTQRNHTRQSSPRKTSKDEQKPQCVVANGKGVI